MKKIPWRKFLACAATALLTSLSRADVSVPALAPDLTWDTPSADSFGSMPLGNGDIGLNVWATNEGGLFFYLSKVDALDASHLQYKLGRVHLQITPNPFAAGHPYRQTLRLEEGSIIIDAGADKNALHLKIWVDANQSVVHVAGASASPVDVTVGLETLRDLTSSPTPEAMAGLMRPKGTTGLLLDNQEDALIWCYRNQTSEWGDHLRQQNTAAFAQKTADPLLHRTSGCLIAGPGFACSGPRQLALKEKASHFTCSVDVLSSQPATPDVWVGQIQQQAAADRALDPATDFSAQQTWWRDFWARSYITVEKCGDAPVELDQCRFNQIRQGSLAYKGHNQVGSSENAFQLTQRYALERFCEACAGRGVIPPPYNGSIFTMDRPAGALDFGKVLQKPVTADYRQWASSYFMWQNTRHPLWSMSTRGDFDTLLPALQMVRDGLEIGGDRCQNVFHHDGAYIMESSWWYDVSRFEWKNAPKLPKHLKYHQLATIELPAIMCDYYEHTRDEKFLNDILLPCAEEGIKFYELQFPRRDAAGKMVMSPAGTVETYQPVTNPCTEIGGLRYVLQKLTALDVALVGQERHDRWTKLLAEMPDTPLRIIRGMPLLAVGEVYAPGREIVESPELYSVYPFRQAWLGNEALLAAARQSFHLATVSLDGTVDGQGIETGGWQAKPVQAASLGLAREAARLTSINFNDQFIWWNDAIDPNAPFPNRPRPRFPAFWETKMDGTPDNDHGANSVNGLESMLLQNDGRKILLLPAWPEDWDVSFKLCANDHTTVECVYRHGRIESLQVTPESRRADVVDFSTLESRVRTLVGVATADRNYLFGIPPMLDGIASPADVTRLKTTGPWLAKYGESLYEMRAGPFEPGMWGGSVYKGSTVYLHILHAPAEGLRLPARGLKLAGSACLTGANVAVVQSGDEVSISMPAEKSDALDTIIRLDFDRPIGPVALALPYAGSLTTGMSATASSSAPGSAPGNAVDADAASAWTPTNPKGDWLQVDLGRRQTFDRMEIIIDNPGHTRGQANPFELEVLQPDGAWKSCQKGAVYGTIYGKSFPAVTGQVVRLKIAALAVRQLDLFASAAGK